MNASSLLIETIRIHKGRVRNIKFHNQRCNASRKLLFCIEKQIDLRQFIDASKAKGDEIKCRITYGREVQKVEYEPYFIRPIHTLKPVEIGDYTYDFKFSDRERLDYFFEQKGNCDDILMTKNGIITDTYYANVALLKGSNWYTPKNPLLKGSSRTRLIQQGKISEAHIHIDQINDYSAISIFNAMIPFKKIWISLPQK